jgi:hypothetical protein
MVAARAGRIVPYHSGMQGVAVFRHLVPIHKDEIHREVMWKEDVHEKQRGEMKNYPHSKDPPPKSPPADREGKQQLPDENKANRERQVCLHLR